MSAISAYSQPSVSDRTLAGMGKPVVYFIRAADHIKIGTTTDSAKKRLSELQVGNPTRLRLLGVIEGDYSLERSIHVLFSENRERGEWFRADPAMVAWIHDHAHPERTYDAERNWPAGTQFCEVCEVRLQFPEAGMCNACREHREHPELWDAA